MGQEPVAAGLQNPGHGSQEARQFMHGLFCTWRPLARHWAPATLSSHPTRLHLWHRMNVLHCQLSGTLYAACTPKPQITFGNQRALLCSVCGSRKCRWLLILILIAGQSPHTPTEDQMQLNQERRLPNMPQHCMNTKCTIQSSHLLGSAHESPSNETSPPRQR